MLLAIVLLAIMVTAFLLFPLDLPSFGSGIWVTNEMELPIEVRIQSALTDETAIIQSGESHGFKFFAGDHGPEFTSLLQGDVVVEASLPAVEKVQYVMPGSELEFSKRALFVIKDDQILREDYQEIETP